MSLETEGYDGEMSEMNRIEWKFYKLCFMGFDMTGKVKFVDHMNIMAEKLKQEIDKNGR